MKTLEEFLSNPLIINETHVFESGRAGLDTITDEIATIMQKESLSASEAIERVVSQWLFCNVEPVKKPSLDADGLIERLSEDFEYYDNISDSQPVICKPESIQPYIDAINAVIARECEPLLTSTTSMREDDVRVILNKIWEMEPEKSPIDTPATLG